jgi:Fur family ferric uptake transcriptional regulator
VTTKLDELRRAIRERGLRATPSRIAVLDLLRAGTSPLSHLQIADRLGSQAGDRATIYRNLIALVNAGLARRTDIGDCIWRFDAVVATHHVTDHPHFVCVECGAVECLPQTELVIGRATAPRAVRQRRVEVHVRGQCDRCI